MRKLQDIVILVCLVFCIGGYAAAGDILGGNPLAGLEQLRPGKTMRSSSSDPDWHNGNGDARPISPGETLELANIEGPGCIRHLWNTVSAQERAYNRTLVIRMYWDGETEPSVEAPLGDFFVVGHGKDAPMESIPVVITSDGRARNCYWPMPFRKSARITVTNEGRGQVAAFYFYVDWQKLRRLPRDTAYFHASYRQAFPTPPGENYLIADIQGRGHYVGTVMNVRQHAASWYGEGDDFFYIDGEKEPSLRGTGSEDYFCDAWGFRQFSGPYYGVPVWGGAKAFSNITAYRWHLSDPVNFEKSLRVEIEHKGVTFNEDGSVKSGFEERSDDYASVAYWYQTEPHKPYPPLPDAYDRLYLHWRNLINAEDLLDTVKISGNKFKLQEGPHWAGEKEIYWHGPEEGHTFEITFESKGDGPCQLILLLSHSVDYGIFRVELDGVPIGDPVDLYAGGFYVDEHYFPLSHLSKGPHTLRFVNLGKNPKSSKFILGLDAILPEFVDALP